VSRPLHATVVIPVYNEASLVAGVVEDTVRELGRTGRPYSILVLNDGSTDWSETLERRLRSLGPVEVRSFAENRGKGAILDGTFPTLDGDLAVVIDADGEYPPADIEKILGPLERGEADWVMGSRYGFGRPRPEQYVLTFIVNRFINVWLGALSGRWFRDVLTGLYGFRVEVVRDLRLRERRFSYTAELMWKLLHTGRVRWAEVPVEYRFRSYAEGKKIRWWETGTILLAMVRYKFARTRAAGEGA
jgi:glycosyltransferase involved in cell wall biosynthesis